MDKTMRDAITACCGTGEIITLCYNGGTHAGLPQELVLHVLHDDKLIASPPGGIKKTYKPEKIAWMITGDGERHENGDAPPVAPKKAAPAPSEQEIAAIKLLDAAITDARSLEIEMGTAWDADFETVPFFATITPIKLIDSARGVRVECVLKHDHPYAATCEQQQEGIRRLPVADIHFR